MTETVYVVVVDTGTEPEMIGFADFGQADTFASVRGSSDIRCVTVLDENEAKALIAGEAKERREQERADRQ